MQKNDSLIALFRIFNLRTDLQKAYPEVFEGNIVGLLGWAITHGSTIDSCREDIIPYIEDYQDILKEIADNGGTYPSDVSLIHRYNIWDDANKVYFPKGYKIYWETLGRITRYQFECMSGNPDIDIIDYILGVVKSSCGTGDLRCGFIGCSEIGRPEVRFYRSGLFREIVVMDIAEGLLSKQRSLIYDEGIEAIKYIQTDFNDFIIDENSYDLIFAWGTVHHIDNLNHFFRQIQRGLKPDGLFIIREYVGPDRLQLTDEQLEFANALLLLIPDDYKYMPHLGMMKKKETRVDREELICSDPSESIHSQDIVSVMKNNLEITEYHPTGGTLLNPLLNGIAGNFEKDKKGDDLLAALIEIEKIVLRQGLFPSDYMFAIAKKKREERPNFRLWRKPQLQ